MLNNEKINNDGVVFQISAVIYHNDNFTVLSDVYNNKIRGIFLEDPKSLVGEKVTFYGEWEDHPKYGKGFSFIGLKYDTSDIFHFLSTMIKGVGNKMAKEIVSKFGDRTEEVIEKNPSRLLEINGIKAKKMGQIVDSWKKHKHLQHLSNTLSPLGVSMNLIAKLHDAWGDKTVEKLKENPYIMTSLKGIGFKKADEVARKMGKSENDPKRIEACIIYCFEKYMTDSGHSVIMKDEIYSNFSNEIKTDNQNFTPSQIDFESGIARLVKNKLLIEYENNYLTISKYDMMEKYIYQQLTGGASIVGPQLCKDIERFNNNANINLGEKQKDAILLANQNPRCFIVAGFAGSGKTTTSKYILNLFENNYGASSIICCALSGVAANRIKNQTGFKSGTIHSVLGTTGNGFEYGQNNKLPYKVVLLDESSMVDVEMFYYLLRAIDFKQTTLIMLGDPAQLNPIGAGNVFHDCISNNLVPSVSLDKIYRQDEKKAISTIANEIRMGNKPNIKNMNYDDFFFIERSIEDKAEKKKTLSAEQYNEVKKRNLDSIVAYIAASSKKISSRYNSLESNLERIGFFQILSPMKEGILGVKNLNKVAQDSINPKRNDNQHIKIGDIEYRVGDKVIHLANKKMFIYTGQYSKQKIINNDVDENGFEERRVYNGQIGIIKDIDKMKECVIVEYPIDKYYVSYQKKEILEGIIDLSYALSIHKTQGSEFSNVIIPMTMSHFVMLNQKLIYTAITRAKDKLVLVGEPNALHVACDNKQNIKRNTIISMICNSEDLCLSKNKKKFCNGSLFSNNNKNSIDDHDGLEINNQISIKIYK